MAKFHCSVASDQRGEPIFATASQVRRWLLVEIRGSWGRDAVMNTDLGRHVSDEWRDRMRKERIRVVAIRRDLEIGGHPLVRLFSVESGSGPWRSGRVWRRDIAGLHAVPHATAALPHGSGEGEGEGEGEAPDWIPHVDPLVLVCTNGRHDSCCATFGRPVIRALRSSAHAASVWECSHIGGDRFAGNVVILPDGLYFGRCSAESGVGVVDAYIRGELALTHYRGRSALHYMHQAAEYFARRELGASAIDAVTAVHRVGDSAAGRFDVDVAGTGTVRVTVRRRVGAAPSALTCTGPTDVTMPSYELVEIHAN